MSESVGNGQVDKSKQDELKLKAKKIISQIYNQLTKGCGKEFCTNKDCASNKVVWRDRKLSDKEALKMAIQFTKTLNSKQAGLKLCSVESRPKTVQFDELEIMGTLNDEELSDRFLEVFSWPFTLAFSFLKDTENYLETEHHNIDFEAVEKFYAQLEQVFGEERMVEKYLKATENFYKKFEEASDEMDLPWMFRSFFIMLQNPCLFNPLCHEIIDVILSLLVTSYNNFDIYQKTIQVWISEFESNRLLDHVQKIQCLLAIQIFNHESTSDNLHSLLENSSCTLDVYNTANELRAKEKRINFTEFYNDGVNREIDLESQYEKWVEGLNYCDQNNIDYDRNINFTLCNFPWLLDTVSKGEIMKYEARAQMKQQADEEFTKMFIMSFQNPNQLQNNQDYMYLKLDVGRETIVEDTLNYLIKEGVNLKKQLKVSFKGEFGQDEGGVQKEFFQILVRDLFKPEFTMFNYFKESKLVWFNGNTFESNIKFELIGALMGLAIYNQIILDIHFPIACYKKLLGKKAGIEDLRELSPSMADSLDFILKWDSPTLEHDLYMTFVYEYEVFGENRVTELKENGSQIYVNQQNKNEYVELLIDFIFNKSIQPQFDSFYRGFHKVCGGDALSLFRPEELQRLICGCLRLDFPAMQRETRYDGYEGEEEVIEWFWDILLKEFNLEQQKRFLFFCTGCDKAPVAGLESIMFIIMKHGDDDTKLPCAQTCFNLLLLPEYSNKDRLRQALLLAINNAEGFGLL